MVRKFKPNLYAPKTKFQCHQWRYHWSIPWIQNPWCEHKENTQWNVSRLRICTAGKCCKLTHFCVCKYLYSSSILPFIGRCWKIVNIRQTTNQRPTHIHIKCSPRQREAKRFQVFRMCGKNEIVYQRLILRGDEKRFGNIICRIWYLKRRSIGLPKVTTPKYLKLFI